MMQKAACNSRLDTIRQQVTGLILAGGEARRFGGQDKGLADYRGRAMLWSAIELHQALLDKIIINANRNLELYSEFGYPVMPDPDRDFKGPLAGMLAGLQYADTELVYVTPCDMPKLSIDVLARMYDALGTSSADLAVASVAKRMEPVVLLMKKDMANSIRCYLDDSGRRTGNWVMQQNIELVTFDDHPEWFVNINTPEDKRDVEKH